MGILNHIRAISDEQKSKTVTRLIEHSTGDFDFFFLVVLSVLMATFGLIENSTAVVIGSMLIAPVLFPLLSTSLSVVMSDYALIRRSLLTLGKAGVLGVSAALLSTIFLGMDAEVGSEILARTEPTLISVAIAIVAGFAVAYTSAKEELAETLPGIAVSVALIPPLATIGIGIAFLDWGIVSGATIYLLVNVVGIIFASMLVFSLMNLYTKRAIAARVADKADKEMKKEEEGVKKEGV